MPLTVSVPDPLVATLKVAVWNHYVREMTRALNEVPGAELDAEEAYQLLRLDNPSLHIVTGLHQEAVAKAGA